MQREAWWMHELSQWCGWRFPADCRDAVWFSGNYHSAQVSGQNLHLRLWTADQRDQYGNRAGASWPFHLFYLFLRFYSYVRGRESKSKTHKDGCFLVNCCTFIKLVSSVFTHLVPRVYSVWCLHVTLKL